ncbi:MAG: energy transducer TonB [Crocinitomicaceae bacterium]|nr:energy transducer TonB [Crocinitomicaceae bacterium]
MKAQILTLIFAVTLSMNSQANSYGDHPKNTSKISSWVEKNIKYPSNAIENKEQGTVYIAFTIVDGKIDQVEVVGSVAESLDVEAYNALKELPVAELNLSSNEDGTYILPIKFSIR